MSTSVSTGLVAATAATLVVGGKNTLTGVGAFTDGTNAATVVVYDNSTAAASGTVLAMLVCPAAAGSTYMVLDPAIRCENGLVVAITGTGAPVGLLHYAGS